MLTSQVLGLRNDEDQRAPVLLLRSFGDDKNLLNFGEWAHWSHMQAWGAYLPMPVSFEEALAAFLCVRVGPVIKVGGLGERSDVHHVKAAAEEWQSAVKEYVSRASLIFVNAGTSVTEGLKWELSEIVAHQPAARLLTAFQYLRRAVLFTIVGGVLLWVIWKLLEADG
jgi:hypothetical protein